MGGKARRRSLLCTLCGGHLRKTAITHEEKRGKKLYLIQNVPARVCGSCGEVWIEGTTLQEIDSLIQEGQPVRKVETPVYDFALAGAK